MDFMSLNDALNVIVGDTVYYNGIYRNSYESAIKNPNDFVNEYFSAGGKHQFLNGTIFKEDEFVKSIKEDAIRCKHVVNTYFLGVYLMQNIDILNMTATCLRNNNEYLWAWFLCSLYHDAAFSNNEDKKPEFECHYGYDLFSKDVLYSGSTLKKYYEKNINIDTSYDGKSHYNHGIIAAEMLFRKYVGAVLAQIKNENDFNRFCDDKLVNEQNLSISLKSLKIFCKIAKIIASHSIYICNQNDIADVKRYEAAGLKNLIDYDNTGRCKMPKSAILENYYDKLYVLLSLVDTIEPTKKDISINNIDIIVANNKISLNIQKISDIDKKNKYLNGLLSLDKWLNFVKIEQQGDIIEIQLYNTTAIRTNNKTALN